MINAGGQTSVCTTTSVRRSITCKHNICIKLVPQSPVSPFQAVLDWPRAHRRRLITPGCCEGDTAEHMISLECRIEAEQRDVPVSYNDETLILITCSSKYFTILTNKLRCRRWLVRRGGCAFVALAATLISSLFRVRVRVNWGAATSVLSTAASRYVHSRCKVPPLQGTNFEIPVLPWTDGYKERWICGCFIVVRPNMFHIVKVHGSKMNVIKAIRKKQSFGHMYGHLSGHYIHTYMNNCNDHNYTRTYTCIVSCSDTTYTSTYICMDNYTDTTYIRLYRCTIVHTQHIYVRTYTRTITRTLYTRTRTGARTTVWELQTHVRTNAWTTARTHNWHTCGRCFYLGVSDVEHLQFDKFHVLMFSRCVATRVYRHLRPEPTPRYIATDSRTDTHCLLPASRKYCALFPTATNRKHFPLRTRCNRPHADRTITHFLSVDRGRSCQDKQLAWALCPHWMAPRNKCNCIMPHLASTLNWICMRYARAFLLLWPSIDWLVWDSRQDPVVRITLFVSLGSKWIQAPPRLHELPQGWQVWRQTALGLYSEFSVRFTPLNHLFTKDNDLSSTINSYMGLA